MIYDIRYIIQSITPTVSDVSALKISPLEGPSFLKDQVYHKIKEAILSLELKPGEALVESELADINNFEDQLQRFRTLSSRLEGRLCKSAEEHTPVFLAFRERDAEKAEQMFRAHLSSVLEDLFREGF